MLGEAVLSTLDGLGLAALPWELPVMQAPIGPAGSWELVAAVSAVGGLGTLAASWTELAELRAEVEHLRSAVSSPFCVNLVLAFDQRERLELVLRHGVSVVSFSWGVDAALIERARSAGASVLVQVGDIQGSRRRPRHLETDSTSSEHSDLISFTRLCRACRTDSLRIATLPVPPL